jgi:hypothetical protein
MGNRSSYEGGFKDGLKHGLGTTYNSVLGELYREEWHQGELRSRQKGKRLFFKYYY